MGKGDSIAGAGMAVRLLLAVLLAWPALASAQALQLGRLGHDASAAEVVSGRLDAEFAPQPGQSIYEQERGRPVWWRVASDAPVPAAGEPQLVLEAPFLHRVEAWVPGVRGPTRHALYGRDADRRYATRALVIPLPHGLRQGEPVWLRLRSPAATPMAISIQSRDQVHRDDLRYVAWRSVILATLLVLAVLAVAFWAGLGDRSYGFFAANLAFAALYLMSMGGEWRDVPLVAEWLSGSPRPQRLFALIALVSSNLFQRVYLDLANRLPWLDRFLLLVTATLAAAALVAPFTDAPLVALVGNAGLLCSAFVVLAASAMLSWRGDRSARILLLSWLPLIVFSTLRAAELMGRWAGPAWLAHALAASFAIASLLLTFGLADKLRELRRDRDRASERASLDALTGALSRAAVEQRLRDAIAAAHADGTALSVAFVDIDHFKRINDSHGHHAGDGCLRYIARRVRNRLRQLDAVGRYGGDELLVLMPDTGLAEAMQQAEHMRAAVACRPLVLEGGLLLDGTLSLGVAELRPMETMEQLLRRADAALYASKAAGRNCVRGDHSRPIATEEMPA